MCVILFFVASRASDSFALNVEGLSRSRLLYCDLSAGLLSCYFTPEEIQAKVAPTLKLPINQVNDTRIRVLETGSMGQRHRTLSIHSPTAEASDPVTFSTESREELDEWVDALHQHLYDQSINSPSKFESITDLIHDKIEQTDGRFLIGHEERREAPNWSSLFDGSQSVLVQKSVLSQSKTSTPVKKRRAPPPPTNQEPYTPPAHPRSSETTPAEHRRSPGRTLLWGSSRSSLRAKSLNSTQTPTPTNPDLSDPPVARRPSLPRGVN
uniref:PH domain-containing protein n=1 Tax=Periophthalmus magnuspinnatus TaxID=409849 RepID=A0A3B4AHH3_9GOBI